MTNSRVETSQKPILLDFSRSELEREVVDVLGQSRFRARQIWQALHRECITDFGAVTTLPKALRGTLSDRYVADPLSKVMHLSSADGSTDKALFRLRDGELVETVLMRYRADGHRKARKDGLRIDASRLRARLHLLCHWSARVSSTVDDGRDRRADRLHATHRHGRRPFGSRHG